MWQQHLRFSSYIKAPYVHLCTVLKAWSKASINNHPWCAHEATKRLKASWLSNERPEATLDQIPLHMTLQVLWLVPVPLGRCFDAAPRSIGRHLPRHDLLSSAPAVVVSEHGVMEDFRGQDGWPFPFNPQGSVSQMWGFKLPIWECGVCVCVCLKCSGAERTKCTGGLKSCLLLQCLSGFINPFHVNISEFKWWRDYFLTIKL